jgi:hypothetical protein
MEKEDGLTSEACMSVRGKRQGAKAKDTNPKGKRIHENMPMAHGVEHAAEEVAACGMHGPAWGRLGRSGQIQGEDSIRNWFAISNGFWNWARLWEFLQGDLGGIFMWGFFLNFSRILNDFRKIQHAMPQNASYARLFEKRFLYASYMIFYVGKLLSLQKAGVTNLPTYRNLAFEIQEELINNSR